jgi:hypothetical protein
VLLITLELWVALVFQCEAVRTFHSDRGKSHFHWTGPLLPMADSNFRNQNLYVSEGESAGCGDEL